MSEEKADAKVIDLGGGMYAVAVPVYFTVAVDASGAVKHVEQMSSDKAWVRNGHNKFGNAYPSEPKGLLARAGRLARYAFLSNSERTDG